MRRTAADRQAEAARYQQITEAQRKAAVESIVEKLEEVDALIQATFGAGDFCWEMHTAIQDIVEEVTFSQERT